MKPTLVSITNPAEYRRYSNGQLTDHIKTESGRSLTAQEVELLRRDPIAFYSNSDEPDAA